MYAAYRPLTGNLARYTGMYGAYPIDQVDQAGRSKQNARRTRVGGYGRDG